MEPDVLRRTLLIVGVLVGVVVAVSPFAGTDGSDLPGTPSPFALVGKVESTLLGVGTTPHGTQWLSRSTLAPHSSITREFPGSVVLYVEAGDLEVIREPTRGGKVVITRAPGATDFHEVGVPVRLKPGDSVAHQDAVLTYRTPADGSAIVLVSWLTDPPRHLEGTPSPAGCMGRCPGMM